ncbi:hypothetical protein M758_9G017200 [Ceratodon purpureus]|nr:hypothetical protein M758_9G017200 [Ceratodon purpureus]
MDSCHAQERCLGWSGDPTKAKNISALDIIYRNDLHLIQKENPEAEIQFRSLSPPLRLRITWLMSSSYQVDELLSQKAHQVMRRACTGVEWHCRLLLIFIVYLD